MYLQINITINITYGSGRPSDVAAAITPAAQGGPKAEADRPPTLQTASLRAAAMGLGWVKGSSRRCCHDRDAGSGLARTWRPHPRLREDVARCHAPRSQQELGISGIPAPCRLARWEFSRHNCSCPTCGYGSGPPAPRSRQEPAPTTGAVAAAQTGAADPGIPALLGSQGRPLLPL